MTRKRKALTAMAVILVLAAATGAATVGLSARICLWWQGLDGTVLYQEEYPAYEAIPGLYRQRVLAIEQDGSPQLVVLKQQGLLWRLQAVSDGETLPSGAQAAADTVYVQVWDWTEDITADTIEVQRVEEFLLLDQAPDDAALASLPDGCTYFVAPLENGYQLVRVTYYKSYNGQASSREGLPIREALLS